MFTIARRTGKTTVFQSDQLAADIHHARSRRELYADPAFARRLAVHVDRLIEQHGLRLLSLDVFDTVLLRDERCEPRRFLQMAEQLAAAVERELGREISALDLFVARLRATRLSYRLSSAVAGCREGSLREIHEWMCHLSGLPHAYSSRSIELELDVEAQNVLLNPTIRPLLELAQWRDVDVVLLSDMYMHREHIAALLERCFPGAIDAGRIYSSADLKISKRSGLLYDHVAAELDIAPAAALHIGDNMESDFLAARRHGWNALYLPHTAAERRAIEEDERRLNLELESLGLVLGCAT